MERSGKCIIFKSKDNAKKWFKSIQGSENDKKIGSKLMELKLRINKLEEENNKLKFAEYIRNAYYN